MNRNMRIRVSGYWWAHRQGRKAESKFLDSKEVPEAPRSQAWMTVLPTRHLHLNVLYPLKFNKL